MSEDYTSRVRERGMKLEQFLKQLDTRKSDHLPIDKEIFYYDEATEQPGKVKQTVTAEVQWNTCN